MSQQQINIIELDNDGRRWVELSGVDYGTDYEFDQDIFGVTNEDAILDADGCGLTEGDPQTIAVRNALDIQRRIEGLWMR